METLPVANVFGLPILRRIWLAGSAVVAVVLTYFLISSTLASAPTLVELKALPIASFEPTGGEIYHEHSFQDGSGRNMKAQMETAYSFSDTQTLSAGFSETVEQVSKGDWRLVSRTASEAVFAGQLRSKNITLTVKSGAAESRSLLFIRIDNH